MPYQRQHAFALSNSEQSPPLWIHISRRSPARIVYLRTQFFAYAAFYVILTIIILYYLLNDLNVGVREYTNTRRIAFVREKHKGSIEG